MCTIVDSFSIVQFCLCLMSLFLDPHLFSNFLCIIVLVEFFILSPLWIKCNYRSSYFQKMITRKCWHALNIIKIEDVNYGCHLELNKISCQGTRFPRCLRQSVWSWRPSTGNHVWISICPNVFSAIFRIQTKNIREKARCECKLKQNYFDFPTFSLF